LPLVKLLIQKQIRGSNLRDTIRRETYHSFAANEKLFAG